MKNYLMVSGHNEKHLSKVESIDGIVMLNLEDGVPKDKKSIALKNILDLLKNTTKKDIVVRINALDETGLNEIVALNDFKVPIRIPKVNSLKELDRVFDLTSNEIHLSIETKEAFFNLKEFKHPQITTFYLGILDLFDELKLNHSLIKFDNQMVHKILIDFALESKYLDVIPVGFVYQKYKDLDGFQKWCEIQKDYGFEGVGCITPNQLKLANNIFVKENIEYAKLIVDRFEKEGPFTIDGLYVDEPIYKNYKQLIE